jgi:putative ABC transport system permease protein
MGASDISWLNLFLGSLILLIPVGILLYYRTGLTKAMLISFGRMAVQLLLVGLYLMYIFELNSLLVNFLWLLLMILAASLSIIKRSEIRVGRFFVPVLMGVLADVVVNFLVFIFIISGTENFFNARYFIPISGMIIGNCLGSGIIGIRSFYGELSKNEEKYKYYLMCGATRNEALFPFMTSAMKDAFSPTIASTATIGLIWLPGMMTGQILGGSDPVTSIKYQIVIIIAIFVGSVLTVAVSLNLSKRFAFDDYDLLRNDVSVSKKNGKKK